MPRPLCTLRFTKLAISKTIPPQTLLTHAYAAMPVDARTAPTLKDLPLQYSEGPGILKVAKLVVVSCGTSRGLIEGMHLYGLYFCFMCMANVSASQK